MSNNTARFATVLIFAAIGAGAWYWWQQRQQPLTAFPETPVAAAPVPSLPASAPAAIQYPITSAPDELAAGAPLPALADSDARLSKGLVELLGRDKVQTFLHLEGFARRVVATTDNLARDHAPSMVWPVVPTPGRFTTLANGGEAGNTSAAVTRISPDNSMRYTPFVVFVESVDTAAAVRFYKQLYPLFQQAYEELGFTGRYFNDRLVAVIDLLLSTPVQAGPLDVTLVEVKGPLPSLRPWVRYEFTDPALNALSSGQKMMLRAGPVNHQRLSAKLLEIRRLVSSGAPMPATPAPRP